MNFLSRIFDPHAVAACPGGGRDRHRRGDSGAIVGVVVWVGITNDRKERLDRRLDEAAGFAIPFLPRGLGDIPQIPQ